MKRKKNEEEFIMKEFKVCSKQMHRESTQDRQEFW